MSKLYLSCLLTAFQFLIPALAYADSPCTAKDKVRYLALGDAYTIGEGVTEPERWPNQLAVALEKSGALAKSGVNIELVGNVARTGWSSEDLLPRAISELERVHPTFVSILIGANDAFRNGAPDDFDHNLELLVNRSIRAGVDPRCILLVTVPDFSETPEGAELGAALKRDFRSAIKDLNYRIGLRAKRSNLAIADIYTLSNELARKRGMLVADGLHPSMRQYAAWVALILPTVRSTMGLR